MYAPAKAKKKCDVCVIMQKICGAHIFPQFIMGGHPQCEKHQGAADRGETPQAMLVYVYVSFPLHPPIPPDLPMHPHTRPPKKMHHTSPPPFPLTSNSHFGLFPLSRGVTFGAAYAFAYSELIARLKEPESASQRRDPPAGQVFGCGFCLVINYVGEEDGC